MLTDREFTYAILAGITIVVIAGICLFYISRKYPAKKEKLDPLFKAVRIWLLIVLGYLLLLFLDVRTHEEAKKDVKWVVGSLFVLLLWYGLVSIFANKPIPSYKLWTRHVLPNIKRFWNAKPYAGSAYAPGMIFHKVISLKGNPMAQQQVEQAGKQADVIDVFFGQARFATTFPFLAVCNKYTGEDIELARPPILNAGLIYRYLGGEAVSTFQPILSQYDTQQEGMENPQQQTVVRA